MGALHGWLTYRVHMPAQGGVKRCDMVWRDSRHAHGESRGWCRKRAAGGGEAGRGGGARGVTCTSGSVVSRGTCYQLSVQCEQTSGGV